MNSLKSVRFVYRQHLLPPIVLPFNKTNSFLNTLGGVTDQKKKKEKLDQINDTIIQQVIKYKEHFISPLKACPFYYEMFDSAVQRKLFSSRVEGKYMQGVKLVSMTQRANLYRQFQKQYEDFRLKTENENVPLLRKVKFVPIFIYDSSQDYLDNNTKKESEMTEIEKEKVIKKYQKKLKQHWQALQELALESGMKVQELLTLQKRQIDPEIPQGLKALLFN